MINPSVNELAEKGHLNRYELVIATAKCARKITDEYVAQRDLAERAIQNKETDKSIAQLVKKEFRDDKAVRTAINRINDGSYEIVEPGADESGDEKVF